MDQKELGDLKSDIESYAAKVKDLVELCRTEEQTKITLINPFIEVLGHELQDPRHVQFEYTVPVRKSKERVDYAIMGDGKPLIYIEAKIQGTRLVVDSTVEQVMSYANQTRDVRFIALTNGVEWRWFGKSQSSGYEALDSDPFLVHNALFPRDAELPFLNAISGDRIDFEQASRYADKAKLTTSVTGWIEEQLSEASLDDKLMKLLAQRFLRRADVRNLRQIRAVWLTSFGRLIEAKIQQRVEPQAVQATDTAKSSPDDAAAEEPKDFMTSAGVVTLSSSARKRAWRPLTSQHWSIENNAAHLMVAVFNYVASVHDSGKQSYFEKAVAAMNGQVRGPNQPTGVGFQELDLGYSLHTHLSNQGKLRHLSRAAQLVVRNGQPVPSLESLVEIWLPTGGARGDSDSR